MHRRPIKNFSCAIDGEKHELNDDQLAKLNKWLEEVIAKIDEKPRDAAGHLMADAYKQLGEVYAGVSGGNLRFSVTPTSMGTVFKVDESITGMELDLSDYDSW